MDERELDFIKPEITPPAQVEAVKQEKTDDVFENFSISLSHLESLVQDECADILESDREELDSLQIKALAEEITSGAEADAVYQNSLNMEVFDVPMPKEELSPLDMAITAVPTKQEKAEKPKKTKKADILPQTTSSQPENKPQENKARAKFILFGKKSKTETTEIEKEELNFFANQTQTVLKQISPKPQTKSKTSAQKAQEKIRAFLEKNQSIPTAFVYYAVFPSPLEREQFLIEKNVNFVKLLVWDGQANVAFSVHNHEVYDVQTAEEITIISGDWQWKIKAYSKAEKFLQNFDGTCKNLGKSPDHKATQAKLKAWHDNLTKRTVIKYGQLEEYQQFLDENQSNNRARYEDSKNDYKECQKAKQSIGSFLKKL